MWDRSFTDSVTDISITPDGLIVAAGSGTVVKSWYNSGAGLGSNTTSRIKHLKMSSDGTHLVTASGNWLWFHHSSGTRIWEKHIQGGSILSLAFSRDGSTIVAGQDDNTITVLDSNSTLLWTAQAGNWVTSVGVSDNGSVIVAGSMDKNLYVFDRKGTPLGTFQAAGVFKSNSVGISGDGSRIVAVDGASVYGFSGSQFSRPVPTGTFRTAIIPSAVQPNKTLTIVTIPTPVSTSPPGTIQTVVPSIPTTTQQSGIPWILSLVPIAVIAFLRQKSRT